MDLALPSNISATVEKISDILIGVILVWIAAFAGILIGWSWRPRWSGRALILLLVAKCRRKTSSSNSSFHKPIPIVAGSSSSSDSEDEQPGLTDADLEVFMCYIEDTDGGPPWELIMERSTPTLAYQAWRRDPANFIIVLSSVWPHTDRMRTIIENASPELTRDFFWDDEFRPKWDNMLVYFRTLNECPHTGAMLVHWIRKFPFFCSDREYFIIRRIWECESTYYCVSKGVPYPSLPKLRSPRRVDLYYSSWHIKAVESRNGGDLTSSEVLFFHHEEMGIPKELAKLGVRKGMWSLVKKLDAGIQAYRMARESGVPPSRYATMAHITTKIPSSASSLSQLENNDAEERFEQAKVHLEPKKSNVVLNWLVVGGILIFCGLNGGAIGKGIIFGIEKGFRKNDPKKMNTKQEGGEAAKKG